MWPFNTELTLAAAGVAPGGGHAGLPHAAAAPGLVLRPRRRGARRRRGGRGGGRGGVGVEDGGRGVAVDAEVLLDQHLKKRK